MQKKLGFLSVVIVCFVLIGLWYYQPKSAQKPIVVRHRTLPITTKQIEVKNNRYGDYLAGLVAQSRQDYAKTVEYYQKALKDDPDNDKLKVLIYVIQVIQGNVEEALTVAEELQKTTQGQLLTEYVLMAHLVKQKEYAKALEMLEHKAPFGADAVLVPVMKAWILAGQGEYQKADEILKNVKNQNAAFVYYRALISSLFQDEASVEKRIKEMRAQSQKGYPSLTAVLFLRDYFKKKNQWDVGQVDYDKIEKSLEKSATLKELMDDIQFPKRMTPELGMAIGFYDVSVALAPLKVQETSLVLNALSIYLYPNSVIPKVWGAELFEAGQNYQLANQLYRQIGTQNDIVLLKMVLNDMTQKKYEEALPVMRKVIQNNGEDAFIQAVMGDILFQLKKYKECIPYYEKAYQIFNKEDRKNEMANTLEALAVAYENSGAAASQVEATLEEALKYNPHQASLLNYLGYFWLEHDQNINQATSMIEEAHKLLPEEGAIMDSLALAYYKKKEYAKALELAEQATDKLPFSSVAYGHLGDIYAALGRTREAVYQYKRALTLNNDITDKLKAELSEKLKQME